MDKFDEQGHARLVGGSLIILGILAFGLILADFLPDDVFTLPPHFFGQEGLVVVGTLMLAVGFYLRRKGL
ncbi:MAG: hypothetical protein O3A75_01720 [Verrucomicrobia bacterium]|nr:hypothetical protein [Verrucomicrobiota bacterium]MDA1203016.1 hypothetical protein [Verrucomicrobiota bacterium]